jgi:hypothetical protein
VVRFRASAPPLQPFPLVGADVGVGVGVDHFHFHTWLCMSIDVVALPFHVVHSGFCSLKESEKSTM